MGNFIKQYLCECEESIGDEFDVCLAYCKQRLCMFFKEHKQRLYDLTWRCLSSLPMETWQRKTCPVTESSLRLDITPVTTIGLLENGTQTAIHSSGILNH